MKYFFCVALVYIVNTFACQKVNSAIKNLSRIYKVITIYDRILYPINPTATVNDKLIKSFPSIPLPSTPLPSIRWSSKLLSSMSLAPIDIPKKPIYPDFDASKYFDETPSEESILIILEIERQIENEKEMNLVEKENMIENILSDFNYWGWGPDPALSPMNTPWETIRGQINNGKYRPLAATNFLQFDMNQIINNSYSIDNIFWSHLNKNSYSPNSNKFKPNPYQSLMLTRDENGFFKIGQ